MKIYILIIILIISGCNFDFLTSYRCIENNKVRPVALIIDNKGLAEAAPRDTVSIHTSFGGEKVKTVQWYFSLPQSTGSNKDSSLLIPGSTVLFTNSFSDSINIQIRIPDSVIIKAFENSTSLKTLLPADTYDSIPTQLLEKKPSEIISALELLAYSDNSSSPQISNALQSIAGNTSSLEQNLPILLQVFTVPIKIHGIINGKYNIEATISVRYNTRLRNLGVFIPVNRNPVINQITLYKVRGELKSFSPHYDHSRIDTSYDFTKTKSITFEKGYSYFLFANMDFPVDTGISMYRAKGLEDFVFEWFYYNENPNGISADSLFLIENWPPNSGSIRLLPPLSRQVRHFSIWLVIYDYYLGERLRPVGFGVKQTDIEIVY